MCATSNDGYFGGIYIIIFADFNIICNFSLQSGRLFVLVGVTWHAYMEAGDKNFGFLRENFGASDIGVTLHVKVCMPVLACSDVESDDYL